MVHSQDFIVLIKWVNKDTFVRGGIMTFWLICFAIILIGTLAIAIYKYDDSEFSKVTDYTFWDMWTNKKVHAAYKLMTMLDHVKGEHKVLLNVHVPNNKGTDIIDALLIHESGIYIICIEAKNGWITGREQDFEWTQLMQNNKKQVFPNPIHKGQRGMYALREQLSDVSSQSFETLVVFSNSCSFQKIELHSKKADVLKTKDLKKWLANLNGDQLSLQEVERIYAKLKGFSHLNKSVLKTTAQPSTN